MKETDRERERERETYTYAEHEAYLGTHRDDASGHKARHAAILTDAFRQLRRAAQRTAEYTETCTSIYMYKHIPAYFRPYYRLIGKK